MKYNDFGAKIKEYREAKKETITQVANAVGKGRTYISKLENGHERPTIPVLAQLTSHFSLSAETAAELSVLAGYRASSVVVEKSQRKEVTEMQNTQIQTPETPPQVQVNVPNGLPVLYSDSVFVTTSQWGVVFDFAQNIGPANQQNVVARLGMSKEHAKALLGVLKKRLEGEEKDHN